MDGLYEQLTLGRELLADDGSFIIQIGPDNVHEAVMLMAEVFGRENHVATIPYRTGTNQSSTMLPEVGNWLVWYAKNKQEAKYNQLYEELSRKDKIGLMSSYAMLEGEEGESRNLTSTEKESPDILPNDVRLFQRERIDSAQASTTGRSEPFEWNGRIYPCPAGRHWSISKEGMQRLSDQNRLVSTPKGDCDGKSTRKKFQGAT